MTSTTNSLLSIIWATTNLHDARKAHTWFQNRSILSKITRDGVTKIEVLVPHPSPSEGGLDQEALISSCREALAKLLPSDTKIETVTA